MLAGRCVVCGNFDTRFTTGIMNSGSTRTSSQASAVVVHHNSAKIVKRSLLEEQESHNVVEKNYRSSKNAVQELRSAAASGEMTTEGKYMGKLGKIVLITGGNSGLCV